MKITREQAKAMGINLPPKKVGKPFSLPQSSEGRRSAIRTAKEKRSAAEQERRAREEAFNLRCDAHGIPRPDFEFEFAKHIGRAWRFDYLFDGWLAVEQEGGIYSNGAHVRGKHFESDIEKYNHCTLLGFSLLRFSPDQFKSGEAFAFIKRVIGGGQEVQS